MDADSMRHRALQPHAHRRRPDQPEPQRALRRPVPQQSKAQQNRRLQGQRQQEAGLAWRPPQQRGTDQHAAEEAAERAHITGRGQQVAFAQAAAEQRQVARHGGGKHLAEEAEAENVQIPRSDAGQHQPGRDRLARLHPRRGILNGSIACTQGAVNRSITRLSCTACTRSPNSRVSITERE